MFKKKLFLFSTFINELKYYWPKFFLIDKSILNCHTYLIKNNLIDYNYVYLNKPMIRTGSIFFFSLKKWQPNYCLLSPTNSTIRTYSSGFILKLYLILPKKFRRSFSYLITYHFKFFRTFLPQRKKFELRTIICKHYKRRYSTLITKGLLPFAKTHSTNLVFSLKTLMTPYTWRRVAPIKKRIRKRVRINS